MAIVKISDLPLVDSPVEGTDLFVVVQDNVTKKAYASDIQTYVGFEEVQTATAGQTVFNLTTMTYAAGANNLMVFVDGVNQYEGSSYQETDNNTVTFTQGLHVGALVKFSTVQTQTSLVNNAGAVTFLQAGTGAVPRSVQSKERDIVSVKDFGAQGDGVTDDAAALQAAINYTETTGGTLYFPAGVYIVGTQLNVSEEGMLFLGAGRDVLDSLTGTVLRTSAAINLFSFTAPSRRTVVQNMVLDGNNVGLTGADVATPKVEFHNCTVTKFVNTGLNIRSFSTLIRECDIVFNDGHGVVYNGDANDSRIVNSSISGNAKHGVFVDTALDYPDGIYLNGLSMENNCTAGSAGTPYAHVFLGAGTVGAYISNMYHESDITQTGFASQLFYNIGDSCDSVFLSNIKSNCPIAAEFNYHARVGAAAVTVCLKNWWAGGLNTAIINNETGVSGSLFTENVVESGVSGFQTKLVDYAGSPSTAGRSLTNSPARLVAKIARTTDQSITSATPATIQFNSATFDPATMFSVANYGIDVREEGYYQVNARITFKSYTAGEVANLQIRVAGSVTDVSRVQLEVTSGTATAEMNSIVKCDAGNRIDVQASKTSNNFDIAGGATLTNLSVVKVAQDAN